MTTWVAKLNAALFIPVTENDNNELPQMRNEFTTIVMFTFRRYPISSIWAKTLSSILLMLKY